MTKEKFHELLYQIKNGNKNAFEKIYDEYYSKMLYVAECITYNREDAKDVVQQALAKFWKFVIDSDDLYIEYPGAYLYTITKRCAIDIMQENGRYIAFDSLETLATDDSYEDRRLNKMDVKSAIKKLKEPEQTVAMQFFLFNVKIKDIAASLGEPVGTIKWRISEIKKQFAKMMK